MTIKEKIELKLKAEPPQPEKDKAGIYIPRNIDQAIRRKTLLELLEEKDERIYSDYQ